MNGSLLKPKNSKPSKKYFMQTKKPNLFLKYILPGALISGALTAVIGLTAANLSGFQIVGHIAGLNEVIRIPMIDYLFIFVLYGIYLGINWLINLFKRPEPVQASTD